MKHNILSVKKFPAKSFLWKKCIARNNWKKKKIKVINRNGHEIFVTVNRTKEWQELADKKLDLSNIEGNN